MMNKQCCKDSIAQGMDFCLECGTPLLTDEITLVSPQPSSKPKPTKSWRLGAIVGLLSLAALCLVGGYYIQRGSREVAVVPQATPQAKSTVTPTGPKAVATPTLAVQPLPTQKQTPEEMDPLTEFVRSKQKATPSIDPYFTPDTTLASTPLPVPTAGPRPTPRSEVKVNASDTLIAGSSWRPEESRRYRFHLERLARVGGSFSARGNISVLITGGWYSSNGEISADSFEVTIPSGTYEVVVTAHSVVSFSIHLTSEYVY
jgi:hypothetical protein